MSIKYFSFCLQKISLSTLPLHVVWLWFQLHQNDPAQFGSGHNYGSAIQRRSLKLAVWLFYVSFLSEGDVVDNKPHGVGKVVFHPDDLGGRKYFEGS
jgi:hypothetical protein